MKKTRRFLCLLLTLVLALSLCAIPAAAADTQTRSDDPVVFVHGLFGWGQRDKIFSIMPYWGMTTGSLPDYLATQGYETYAASVGPLSSAWDRACELYAQLVGARTDYGVKHAQDFGHERYGIDYETPLFEGWGTQRAVNLVGHSFGGATTRLFLEILTNGCPEEVAAAKAAGVAPSPFFLGGKGSWVHSLTAIAAPHNGTTFIEANSDFTKLAADLATGAAKALGLSSLKGVYDFQLDQFGIRKDDNETFAQALDRVLRSDFLSHNDNAFLDLTIDKSLEINKGIEIQPNVYYFSYAGDQTSADPLTGNHYPTVSAIPSNGMSALMMPGSINMGKYYDKYTAAASTSTGAGCRTTALSTPCPRSTRPRRAKTPPSASSATVRRAGLTMTAIPTSPSGPASGTSCPSRAPTICSSSAASPTRASSRRTCSIET